LEFTYDPSGKRISKTHKPRANGILKDEVYWTTTFYVYDATGNVMAVYERSYQALSQFNLYKESVRLIEQHIYGSDRIGLRKCNVLVYEDVFSISAIDSNTHEFMGKAKPVLSGGDGTGNGGRGPVASPAVHVIVGSNNHLAEQYQRTLGDKRYELKNHLGNVLSVITDRKIGVDNVSYVSGNGTYIPAPSNNQLYLHVTTGTFIQLSNLDLKVDYYTAEIVKSTEYSCYGVELAGWGYINVEAYRYGFNGQECDYEVSGNGNSYTAEFWQYSPRLGRRWNKDPVIKEFEGAYATFAGNPIWYVDPKGDDWYVNEKSGEYTWFEGNGHQEGYVGVGYYKVTYDKDENSLSIYQGKESEFVEKIDMSKDENGKYKSERAAKFALISAEIGGTQVHDQDPTVQPLIVGAIIDNRLKLDNEGKAEYSSDGTTQGMSAGQFHALKDKSYIDFAYGEEKRWNGNQIYQNIGLSTVYTATIGAVDVLNKYYKVIGEAMFGQMLFYAHGKNNSVYGDFEIAIPAGTTGFQYVRGSKKYK
jgi:hypothetical protein